MTAPGPQQADEVDRVAYGSLRGRPRVMGVCPSCGIANLALSEGRPHVVCGNLRCTDPTAPSAALGRTPVQPDEVCMCGKPESDQVHGAPKPYGHPCLPARGHPAAPPAQPGEVDELDGILALDAALHRLGPGALRQRSHRRLAQLLYADGVRVVDPEYTPAQPVRDTGGCLACNDTGVLLNGGNCDSARHDWREEDE